MLPPCQMLTMKKRVAPCSAFILTVLGLVLLSGCADPGPRALLQGERLLRGGQSARAIQKLELATRLLPRDARAWNHLGLAYHGAGRREDAVKAYQQALALDRNLAAAHYNLGCLYLEQNNAPAAVAALTSLTPRIKVFARRSSSIRVRPKRGTAWAWSRRSGGVTRRPASNSTRRCGRNRTTPRRCSTRRSSRISI